MVCSVRGVRGFGAIFVAICLLAAPALAQDKKGGGNPEVDKILKSIAWQSGPTKVTIGSQGEMEVPEGYVFTAGDGARKMLELMHNPTDGRELGLLTTTKMEWFVVFDFMDIGYIKDADKEELDAEDLLDSIKEGTEASNEERKKRGWSTIDIVGWQTAPYYDTGSKNLLWCIEGKSEGRKIVNYNTRILGREGVMSANLMVAPDKLESTIPTIKGLLDKFSFVSGKKYAEFKSGDKVAKYGLAALVAVGAGAAAAKLGVFAWIIAKMGKLWKLIIVGFIGIVASIKKFLFGAKEQRVVVVGREQADEAGEEGEGDRPPDNKV